MTQAEHNKAETLQYLGWTPFFSEQVSRKEADLLPLRINGVHRRKLTGLSDTGQIQIELPPRTNTGDFAVGDWVLIEPYTNLLIRRLDRKTVLERSAEGQKGMQLVAANVDTLLIVASCNADFNLARLERYLAFANEAGAEPVIVLTKADLSDDVALLEQQAASLQRGLTVISLNAKTEDAAAKLRPWCGPGTTIALVGSSGVGKSTLVNNLVGSSGGEPQQTGDVRKGDDKGRHTTTSRSLHAMAGGSWVIDTPGVRSLHLKDVAQGLDTLFAEITELAPSCKFRNCSHDHEPGCAVRAAVAAGELDPDRLDRWKKLQAESRG